MNSPTDAEAKTISAILHTHDAMSDWGHPVPVATFFSHLMRTKLPVTSISAEFEDITGQLEIMLDGERRYAVDYLDASRVHNYTPFKLSISVGRQEPAE